MTRPDAAPFSRPVPVASLPPEGFDVKVEATPEECAAVARQFGLPAIHALSGRYHLKGSEFRVAVTGRVTASVAQTCVVSLDDFDSVVEEEVEVDFAVEGANAFGVTADVGGDPPDPIVDGRVDLGALTAEFLALGLDPHPRKPGACFAPDRTEEGVSPFADLARWKTRAERKP
jgi:hypothetical protein